MSKIKFHHLKPTPGSTKSKIRKGRGEAGKEEKLLEEGQKEQEQEKQYLHTLKADKFHSIEESQNLRD